jgi:hypothetical protein
VNLPDEDNPAGDHFLVLGAILLVAGAFMLHCYFDRSGRDKPFVAKILSGLW